MVHMVYTLSVIAHTLLVRIVIVVKEVLTSFYFSKSRNATVSQYSITSKGSAFKDPEMLSAKYQTYSLCRFVSLRGVYYHIPRGDFEHQTLHVILA